MREKKSKSKKKLLLIPVFIVLFLVLAFGLISRRINIFPQRHNIRVTIEQRDENGKSDDVLTLYNGDGELIETITVTSNDTEFVIPYNKLTYREKITIHSEKMNSTYKIYSISDQDHDGSGDEPMSMWDAAHADVSVYVYYQYGHGEFPEGFES